MPGLQSSVSLVGAQVHEDTSAGSPTHSSKYVDVLLLRIDEFHSPQ